MRKQTLIIQIAVMSMLAMFVSVSLVSSAVKVDTSELREAVTVDGVRAHQQALQDIADDYDGIRESSSPGYFASVDYVADKMEFAGYNVEIQPFEYPFFEELDPAELELPYEQPMHFEGLEGEAPVEVDPKGLRRRYREEIDRLVDLLAG